MDGIVFGSFSAAKEIERNLRCDDEGRLFVRSLYSLEDVPFTYAVDTIIGNSSSNLGLGKLGVGDYRLYVNNKSNSCSDSGLLSTTKVDSDIAEHILKKDYYETAKKGLKHTRAFGQDYLYGESVETGNIYAEVLVGNPNKRKIEVLKKSKSLDERQVSLELLSRGYFAKKGMNPSLTGKKEPCLELNRSKNKGKQIFEGEDSIVDKILEDLHFETFQRGAVMVAAPKQVKLVAHEMIDGERFQLEHLNNGEKIMFDRYGQRVNPGRRTARHILGENLRWKKQGPRGVVANVTNIIKSLVRQGNTIEIIDRNRKRRTTLFTKDPQKRDWFQMIRIAHNSRGDNAQWDIRKDSLIRNLCQLDPHELENYIDNTLIMSASIQKGWSGVLLYKEQVVDFYNVNWSEEGWCVVQGRDEDGRITNALLPGDYLVTQEFYTPRYYRSLSANTRERFGEHSKQIEMRLEQILNEVRRVQTESYGMGSIEIWRSQLERDVIHKWSIKFTSVRGFIEHMERVAVRYGMFSNFKHMHVGGTNDEVWKRFQQVTVQYDEQRKDVPSLPTWGFGKFGPNTTGFVSLGDDPDLCWKNGYCYIWIFYSMINHAVVKNYTSFAQRILEKIEQLGEFPLLKYVVAHCYDLIKEFPGLEWIPMPRIWKTTFNGAPILHAVATDGMFCSEQDRCHWWYLKDMIEFFMNDLSLADVVIGGLDLKKLTSLVKLIPKPREFIKACDDNKSDFVDMVTTPGFAKGFCKLPKQIQESLLQTCVAHGSSLGDILATIQQLDVPINYAESFVNHLSLIKHFCRLVQDHTIDDAVTVLLQKRLLDIDVALEEKKDLERLQFVGAREKMEKNYDQRVVELLRDLCEEHAWFGGGQRIITHYYTKIERKGSKGFNYLRTCGDKMIWSVNRVGSYITSTMWENLFNTCRTTVARLALRTGISAFLTKYKITLSATMILFSIVMSTMWLLSKMRNFISGPTQHVNINFQPNFNSRNAPIEQFAPVHIVGTDDTHFTPAEIPVSPRRYEAVVQAGQKTLFKYGALAVLITALWDYSQSDAMLSVLMKLNSIQRLLAFDDTRAVVQAGGEEFEEQMEIVGTSNRIVEILLKPVQPEVVTYDETLYFKQHFEEVLMCGPHLKLEYHGKEVKTVDRSGIPNLVEHIVNSSERRFIVEGRVGCGKSTYLPHLLAKEGKVLICENSRALTINVAKNLSDDFHESVTVKMGGHAVIGYGNITVATSGYVYHAYYSRLGLNDYKYIIIDECHLLSTDVLVLKALLQHRYKGKIIECSATPIGMKVAFTTNKKVTTIQLEDLHFEDIPKHFGKGTKHDITCGLEVAHILVYVSSYNEVDTLVRTLLRHNIQCLGIDGRKDFSVGDVKFPGAEGHSVIVATNIIENGVTIDANVVVDFGTRVQATFDEDNRAIVLGKVRISNAERHQRKGRVGRKEDGFAVVVGRTQGNDFSVSKISLTESAALSFALGLPSVVEGVDNEYFASCTRTQLQVAMNYEMPLLFSAYLFDEEGRTTAEIYQAIKPTIKYNQQQKIVSNAIKSSHYAKWKNFEDYVRGGIINADELRLYAEEACWRTLRVPVYTNNVGLKLLVSVAKAIKEGFKTLTYKTTRLQTEQLQLLLEQDRYNVDEVLQYLRSRLNECKQKYNTARDLPLGSSSTWLSGILPNCVSKVRGRYVADLTENIKTLTEAIQQVEVGHMRLEMNARSRDEYIKENPQMCLCAVIQCCERSENTKYDEVTEILQLRGMYKWKTIFKDIVFCVGFLFIMIFFIWNLLETKPTVGEVEGKGNKHRRNTRGLKEWSILTGGDGEIREEVQKKKTKYKAQVSHDPITRKRRVFSIFYGDDVENVNRFQVLNPLDGTVLVGGAFDQFNADMAWKNIDKTLKNGTMEVGMDEPRMEVILFKQGMQQGIKRILTPHNPQRVGMSGQMGGFERYEGVWRQTGRGIPIEIIQTDETVLNVDATPFVPKTGKFWADIEDTDDDLDEILATLEGRAIHKGNIRTDVITNNMCIVTYGKMVVKGVLYGKMLIVPIHLTMEGPGCGDLRIQTKTRGVINLGFGGASFRFKQLHPSDVALVYLTEEVQPFAQSLKFRVPKTGESIRILSCGFSKTAGFSYYTSAECITKPLVGTLWEHTISTVQGLCGCPVQAVSDGFIVGFHSIAMTAIEKNGFTPVSENFLHSITTLDSLQKGQWHFNKDLIDWGALQIINWKPLPLPCDTHNLTENGALVQGGWVTDYVENGMLQRVAELSTNLVNKHVVVGRCSYFDRFIKSNPHLEMLTLTGNYSPSALNQDAYRKDVLKYDKPLNVGLVDMRAYAKAERFIERLFIKAGIIDIHKPTKYIFDCDEICSRLKKETALGAQYQGKKDVYLQLEPHVREKIFDDSILKVYKGEMGIWKTSLKAELRPNEKVNENKTRTFTAAPLESVLVGKICVDEFNERFYDNHLLIPSTVGINKFNRGWNQLLEKLPEGWVYCCADGSRFDSSITPLLFNTVLKLRLMAMEEDDFGEVLLRNLYTEIVYTPMSLADGNVCKKFRGNNSGQPSTVVDNTIVVMLAVIYSLFRQGFTDATIKERTVFFANGDDLIISMPETEIESIRGLDKYFRELSLNYNFEDVTRNKKEIEFMSHKAMKLDGIWIPKLAKERIVAIVEWQKASTILGRHSALQAARVESFGYNSLSNTLDAYQQFLLNTDFYDNLTMEEAKDITFPSWEAIRNLYCNVPLQAVVQAGEDENASQQSRDDFRSAHEQLPGASDSAAPGVPESLAEMPPLENLPPTSPMSQSAQGEGVFPGESSESGRKQQQDRQSFRNFEDEPTRLFESHTVTPGQRRDMAMSKQTSRAKGFISLSKDHGGINKLIPMFKGKRMIDPLKLVRADLAVMELRSDQATDQQLNQWCEKIMRELPCTASQISDVLNAWLLWCISNGTTMQSEENWVMYDENGEQQMVSVEPFKPIGCTLRKVMRRFSAAAEQLIKAKMAMGEHIPMKWANDRNIRNKAYLPCAFDFWIPTNVSSPGFVEAHNQMKAATIGGSQKLFGLDGNLGQTEVTERHTAADATSNIHHIGPPTII